MKKGWPRKTLGEVCQFRGGGTPSKSVERYWLGDIPWVSPKDVKSAIVSDSIDHISQEAIDGSATSLIPKDAVLMVVRSGILARTVPIAITGRALTINQDLKALCPNGAVDARFLYHLLESKMDVLLSMVSRGATVHRLMTEQIRALDFLLPPLAEQQRIVGVLDEAFAGLATAQANADKNLQNARALFESHHHSIFTQRRDGWEEKPLGDVCEYVNGKAHEQCIDEDGRFIVINSKFISRDGEALKRSNQALLLLQPGEIAMVLSDVPNGKALAKCFLVEQANTYTLNQRICLIRSKKFHTKFLFYQLNRNRHFLAFNNGENQTNLRLNQILSCPLYLPPLTEQEAIADKLDALATETQRLESHYAQKQAALAALKKSLLHQAFTGAL